MHKLLFYSKFVICLYMFQAVCDHHQGVKIVLYSIWYRHICGWPSSAQVERGLVGMHGIIDSVITYKCDDARCCVIQF